MSRDDPQRCHGGRPIIWVWDGAAEAELIRRYEADEPLKAIAFDMDRPRHAIDAQLMRLREQGRIDLRNRSWRPEEKRQLMAALDAGARPRDLVPVLKRSRGAIRQAASMLRKARREAAEREDHDQLQLRLEAA